MRESSVSSRRSSLVLVLLLALGAASCSSGDAPEDGAEPAADSGEPTGDDTPEDGVEPAADSGEPTGDDTKSTAPTGVPLVEGLPVMEVLGPAEGGVGPAPMFRWEAVTGAVRYSLAVRGPDGPIWGWQGDETEVYMGGLTFERPAGWAGPEIVAGTCWSVMARDGDGHVIAVSELLPVSPGDPAGHDCLPGQGEEPTA
jgi:hypothetical protein